MENWGTVADWVMAGAAVLSAIVALVAAVFAGLGWKRAAEANRAAHRSATAAEEANVISRQQQAAAAEANRIAEKAAERAEAAEERQKASEQRMLEIHDVDWHCHWAFPRLDPSIPESLIDLGYLVENTGTDSAHNVRVRFDVQGDAPAFNLGTVDGGQMVGVVPISDLTSSARLGLPYDSEHDLEDFTLDRARYWLNTPTRVVINWETALGAPKRHEEITQPFLPLCSECGRPKGPHHHHAAR